MVPSSDLRHDFALTIKFSYICSDKQCSFIFTLCMPAQTFSTSFIAFHSLTLMLAGTEKALKRKKDPLSKYIYNFCGTRLSEH